MRSLTVNLEDGLLLGGTPHKVLILRDLLTADYLDALADSERAVLAPTGEYDQHGNPHLVPTLLVSAPLLDIHTLRRQVVSFGDIPADPLPIEQLRQLSEADLELIRIAAEQLAERAPVEVVQRGRPDPASEGSSPVNGDSDYTAAIQSDRAQANDGQRNEQLG